MTYRLFIDDEREPGEIIKGSNLCIARSYDEAIEKMKESGCPDVVYFDHDLGDAKEKTGYDIAKWMVYRDMYGGGQKPTCYQEWLCPWIPHDFRFYVHSMNPIGARNILDYLSSYLNQRMAPLCRAEKGKNK